MILNPPKTMTTKAMTTKTADLGQKEIRAFSRDCALEIRQSENALPVLTGYAALFDVVADLHWYREKIDKRAFSRSLSDGDDIRALVDHDVSVNNVLGRRSADTLKLNADSKGLKVEISLPATQTARDLTQQIDNGNISGMSFGFFTREETWDYEEEPALRTLLDVELIEVSVVTFPAYPDTTIAKRSFEHAQKGFPGDSRRQPTQTPPLPSREVLMARHKLNTKRKNR